MSIPSASWTFLKGTPYTAVYRVDGGSTLALPFNPTMRGQLHEGPLKAELARLAAVNDLESLNLDDENRRVRIYFVSALDGNYTQTMPGGNAFYLSWTATGLIFGGGYDAESGAAQLLIEIRFIHSAKR